MKDVIIRKVRKEDLPELSELHLKLTIFEKKFNPLLKTNRKEFIPGSKKRYEQQLKQKNQNLLVAEHKKQLIAFCTAHIDSLGWYMEDYGYLDDLYVLPKYRGKNIATELINETMVWFKSREIKDVILSVLTKNSALALYEKLGFEEYVKRMRLKI